MLRSLGIGIRVTWASLPGKPAVFPPAPHTHPWSDLMGVPASFPPAAHTHAWGDITAKPVTFPPASHTHPWSDITATPATYPPSSHTHAWSEITGKPTTFAPSAHTHLWADITDRPTIPAVTPLGTTAALALAATASAGSSTSAAREDHVHPLPSGRLTLIGTVTVAETTLLALGLGMKRMALTLAGVATSDRLVFVPTGVPTAGCEAVNAYVSAANQVTIAYFTPALGLGVAYSIPIAVYRIT